MRMVYGMKLSYAPEASDVQYVYVFGEDAREIVPLFLLAV